MPEFEEETAPEGAPRIQYRPAVNPTIPATGYRPTLSPTAGPATVPAVRASSVIPTVPSVLPNRATIPTVALSPQVPTSVPSVFPGSSVDMGRGTPSVLVSSQSSRGSMPSVLPNSGKPVAAGNLSPTAPRLPMVSSESVRKMTGFIPPVVGPSGVRQRTEGFGQVRKSQGPGIKLTGIKLY